MKVIIAVLEVLSGCQQTVRKEPEAHTTPSDAQDEVVVSSAVHLFDCTLGYCSVFERDKREALAYE